MTTTRKLSKAVFWVPCLTALAYLYDGSMVQFEPFVREGLESCDQLAPELGHLVFWYHGESVLWLVLVFSSRPFILLPSHVIIVVGDLCHYVEPFFPFLLTFSVPLLHAEIKAYQAPLSPLTRNQSSTSRLLFVTAI